MKMKWNFNSYKPKGDRMKKTMSLSLVILALYIVPAIGMEEGGSTELVTKNEHLKALQNALNQEDYKKMSTNGAWIKAQQFMKKDEKSEEATPEMPPTMVERLHKITDQSLSAATSEDDNQTVFKKLGELTQCIPTVLVPATKESESSLKKQLSLLTAQVEQKQEKLSKLRDAFVAAKAEKNKLQEKKEDTENQLNKLAVITKLLENVRLKNEAEAEKNLTDLKSKIEALLIEKNNKETKYNSYEDVNEIPPKLKESLDSTKATIQTHQTDLAVMEKEAKTFGEPPKGLIASLFS